ncbi:MAG TPA: amidophosphoribosyltransferase [Bacillota bacterium]|nr:amidophosphoribosyltransferase [Bacillota bacterium]
MQYFCSRRHCTTNEDKPHEECAVFGISLHGSDEAAGLTYNALLSLQHRGQEGSGIAVTVDNQIVVHKGMGLVGDVFGGGALAELPKSSSALGHNRYSTAGGSSEQNVQPFVTEYLTGRHAAAHNGNVTNADELREWLRKLGVRFEATSDSEVISALVAYYTVTLGDIKAGVKKAVSELRGAFSLVILCGDGRIVAVRDADGFRPLCIGVGESGIAVASESCALDAIDYKFLRDVEPGELVVFEGGELVYSEKVLTHRTPDNGLCIFEYVYFARPDSVIDGVSVYEARFNMGRTLAREHPAEADVVCGVPDSGLEAAAGFAAESGLPLVAGFVKNRYLGRSFIYPTQAQRKKIVKLKLNPLRANIEGKRVVLVDDSIVRGTTSEKIVASLREAGAKEVHLRISSPPFRHVCRYGTDIASEDALIANHMTVDQICKKLGADSLGYISVEGLVAACGKPAEYFCKQCFVGRRG